MRKHEENQYKLSFASAYLVRVCVCVRASLRSWDQRDNLSLSIEPYATDVYVYCNI